MWCATFTVKFMMADRWDGIEFLINKIYLSVFSAGSIPAGFNSNTSNFRLGWIHQAELPDNNSLLLLCAELFHLASAGLFLATIDQPEIVFMFTLLGDIEGVTSAYDQFTAFKKAH